LLVENHSLGIFAGFCFGPFIVLFHPVQSLINLSWKLLGLPVELVVSVTNTLKHVSSELISHFLLDALVEFEQSDTVPFTETNKSVW